MYLVVASVSAAPGHGSSVIRCELLLHNKCPIVSVGNMDSSNHCLNALEEE